MKRAILLLIFSFNFSYANEALQSFQTTNLTNYKDLNEAFALTRRNGGGECYQRAHYWSYQLYKSKNYRTEKFFFFFSAKYKRLITSQWWFHVAPGILLNGRPYIFDNQFVKKPVSMEAWKNGALDHGIRHLTQMKKNFNQEKSRLKAELKRGRISRRRSNFISRRLSYIDSQEQKYLISNAKIIEANSNNWPYQRDGRKELIDLKCKEISTYSDYKKYGEKYYCFIYRASMFYFEPGDLEKLEKSGIRRSQWSRPETYTAFRNAFGGRFPY